MTKIDKNVTKQFFKITMLVIVGLVGLSIITQLKRAIVNVNSGTMTVLESTIFLLGETPRTTVMLMPIATLLGSMMTMNNMAKTSEIIALKTAGISFKRIVKYPMIMALIFAIMTGIISDKLSTKGRKVKREMKEKYGKEVYYSSEMSRNIYMRGQNGEYIINIATVFGDKGELFNAVLIFQNETGLLSKIIAIDTAKYDPYLKVWKGKNVFVKNIVIGTEENYSVKMIPELQEKPMELISHKFYMGETPMSELRKNAIFIKASGGDVKEYILELHKRLAEPLLVFIISFFGFALGSKFVRGGAGVSIAIGVLLGFSTYIVTSLSDAFVSGNYISPEFGAWLPCMIFFAVSLYTMNQAEY